MDQEWDLSIQMTERYTLGPLGDITSTPLASMWIVHKDVDIIATRKEYLSGNEIELGMVDTNDRISDK